MGFDLKIEGDFPLDPKKIGEDALFEDAVKKVPALKSFRHLIRFKHEGSYLYMILLDGMPIEIVNDVNEAYK